MNLDAITLPTPSEMGMFRKTLRIVETRTSMKLEILFWKFLKYFAKTRRLTLTALLNEIFISGPEPRNFASLLRTFALKMAISEIEALKSLSLISSVSGTDALFKYLHEPIIVVDEEMCIREMNGDWGTYIECTKPRDSIGNTLATIFSTNGGSWINAVQQVLTGKVPFADSRMAFFSRGDLRIATVRIIGFVHQESRFAYIVFNWRHQT